MGEFVETHNVIDSVIVFTGNFRVFYRKGLLSHINSVHSLGLQKLLNSRIADQCMVLHMLHITFMRSV